MSSAAKPVNRNWFYVVEFVRALENASAPTIPATLGSAPKPGVRSPSTSSTYRTLTGAEIVAMRGDSGVKSVGRQAGPNGTLFAEDVATGDWRTWRYAVSPEPRPRNKNWFTVEEFLARVQGR